MDHDWNRIEGNWKQAKGKIKERYGIEKDRIKRDIDDWSGRQTW
ncbi:CsbD family protein [Rhizobium ruizarguesonis]